MTCAVYSSSARLGQHVLARRAELVDDVDVRRRDERVDPRSFRVAHSSRRGLHVGRLSSSEPGDDRALDLACYRLHRLEVARRRDREAGLDHVDSEARELVGDLELLCGVQRDARRLLAVAQRGVEDADVVGVDAAHDVDSPCSKGSRCCFSQSVCGSAAATQIAPPIGGAGEAGRARVHASCADESKRSGRSCGRTRARMFVERGHRRVLQPPRRLRRRVRARRRRIDRVCARAAACAAGEAPAARRCDGVAG
jgi:hypothetical protein